ncbi:hypothetical protein CVT24_012783 [Panaeolus cyanescens]|uniref:Uncharacterized protein n=1 Tax=Panaeolus cyanescens TaxID=181874 RepID=A0A409X4E0_9AGAR|nr:hypothetical protein CVT24_012783 [Panaeolus cyanescens]
MDSANPKGKRPYEDREEDVGLSKTRIIEDPTAIVESSFPEEHNMSSETLIAELRRATHELHDQQYQNMNLQSELDALLQTSSALRADIETDRRTNKRYKEAIELLSPQIAKMEADVAVAKAEKEAIIHELAFGNRSYKLAEWEKTDEERMIEEKRRRRAKIEGCPTPEIQELEGGVVSVCSSFFYTAERHVQNFND